MARETLLGLGAHKLPIGKFSGHYSLYASSSHNAQLITLALRCFCNHALIQIALSVPSGPGFVSTSPAITSNRGITTTMTLSSIVHAPPGTVPFTRVMATCWLHRTLPPPPLPLSLDQEWTTYCSINDRATTVMQPLSIRGVSCMTSPTPQLATPGWYSRPPCSISPPGLEGAAHVVVVEPNSSSPCGKINPHDQFVAVNRTHT